MITDSKNNAFERERAFQLAIAVLAERISGLPEEDRKDLFDLLPGLFSHDEEERLSADRAAQEILSQSPMKVVHQEFEKPPSDDLKKWLNFVSAKIREVRKKAGMTQKELEEKTGIPQSHISRLEKGEHSPSFATLEKIAEATGVPVSELDPSA